MWANEWRKLAPVTTMPEDQILDRLQARLRTDVDRIAELMLAAHRREIPDLPADEELHAALREAVRADLVDAFTAFRLEQELPRSLTFETSHWARQAARSRVPLPTLLRLFRVGQRVVWREVCALLDEVEPDAERRESLLRLITDVMLEGGDRASTLQTEEYLAERDRIMRSRAQARLAVVQQILVDGTADASSLDYDLSGEHVAIVASGADAERVMRAVAEPRRLILQAGPEIVWAWFGGEPSPLSSDSSGVSIGIGRPASGREGFVVSHEQARAAHSLGRDRDHAVTRFDAVSLEWLATRDRAASARFVTDELGPLLDENDRSGRLVDTLEAYLEAGYNASSMAARLGISVRTASYRIRSIEELLERTIASRNAELHTAVRLHRLLDRD
jgi:hypothetical protein